MGFRKTEEEKAEIERSQAQEAAALRAEHEAVQRRIAHEEWLKSPIGLATVAKEERRGFFEIDVELGFSNRRIAFASADFDAGSTRNDSAGLLSDIEAIGWRLEHAGYYFLPTGEESRAKILGTGQNIAVSGSSRAVYLFRNVD